MTHSDDMRKLSERMSATSSSPTLSGASNSDMVNHPPHYNKGKFETIEVLEDIARFYHPLEAYNVGQVIKYLARAPHKGAKLVDIKKAQWYLNRLIEQARP